MSSRRERRGFSPTIVLASASEQRLRLLADAGLSFEVDPAGIEETLVGSPLPWEAAEMLALRKARSVAIRRTWGTTVLGADTVVALAKGEGAFKLLGKPADAAAASEMLTLLSASRHVVVTAVAVVVTAARGKSSLFERVAHETTWVSMRAILPLEREGYVRSGEWRGKAGGYAIQASADAFVTELEGGGFDNVVGLPVRLSLDLLRAAGASIDA